MTGSHACIDASAGVAGDMLLGALVDAGADLATVQGRVDPVLPGRFGSVTTVTRAGLRATKVDVDVQVDDPPHRTWRTIADLIASAACRTGCDLRTGGLRPTCRRGGSRPRRPRGGRALPRGGRAGLHRRRRRGVCRAAPYWASCRLSGELGGARVRSRSAPRTARSSRCRRPGGHSARPRLAGPRRRCGVSSPPPTGMALVAALAEECRPTCRGWRSTAVGVGAGTRDTVGRPNVTRVIVGQPDGPGGRLPIASVVLDANVDDLDPRLWPGMLAVLLDAGASDAWLIPIVMKKGRPAHTLSVLCHPTTPTRWRVDLRRDQHPRHSPTYGRKHALPRGWVDVAVAGGSVAIKLAHRDGVIVQASPNSTRSPRWPAALDRRSWTCSRPRTPLPRAPESPSARRSRTPRGPRDTQPLKGASDDDEHHRSR